MQIELPCLTVSESKGSVRVVRGKGVGGLLGIILLNRKPRPHPSRGLEDLAPPHSEIVNTELFIMLKNILILDTEASESSS